MITANTARLEVKNGIYQPKRFQRADKCKLQVKKYPFMQENSQHISHFGTSSKSSKETVSFLPKKISKAHWGSGDYSAVPYDRIIKESADICPSPMIVALDLEGHADTKYWDLAFWDGILIPKGFSSRKTNTYYYSHENEKLPTSKTKSSAGDLKLVKSLSQSARDLAQTLKEANTVSAANNTVKTVNPTLLDRKPTISSDLWTQGQKEKSESELLALQSHMQVTDLTECLADLEIGKICKRCASFEDACLCCAEEKEEDYQRWSGGKYITEDKLA